MPSILELSLLCLLLGLVDFALILQAFGPRAAVFFGVVAWGGACTVGLVHPLAGASSLLLLMSLFALVGSAILLVPVSRLRRLCALLPSVGPGVWNLSLALYSGVVLLGGAEILARSLCRDGDLEVQSFVVAVSNSGALDYRGFHVFADSDHVHDPELMWIPRSRSPFTEQRFRGPVLEVPKPEEVFRILCYGDSNTQGDPNAPSWPERLHRRLRDGWTEGLPEFEVANAGVAGYSSHQGLLRFRRELEEYEPDLVFVSFGWNDCAPASGVPDSEYVPPGRFVAAVSKVLVRYRFVTGFLRQFQGSPEARSPLHDRRSGVDTPPRVRLETYLKNLAAIDRMAKDFGARAVFLTRPHRPASSYDEPRFKRMIDCVARYNRALIEYAANGGLDLVDLQGRFSRDPESSLVDSCHFGESARRETARLLADHVLRLLGSESDPSVLGSPNVD